MRKLFLAAAAASALAVAGTSQASLIWGVDQHNNLFSFDSAAPGAVLTAKKVAVPAGEQVVAIDFRPADGNLYAMTDTGGLYVVNITASPANTWSVTDTGTTISGVNGTSFGFDFNPVVDRLRVTSDTDINLRHQIGGATIVDGNLNAPYGNPSVVGAAYLNNFAGTTTTTLFTIDSANDSLNTQNPPNAGTQVVVGPLGIDVNSEELGFDIESGTNVAYLAANVGPDRRSGLYTVNLATGATTSLGLIGNGTLVRDITVVIPEPASLAVLAGLGVLGLRRRA
jgi:hypothetical protein